MTHVRPHDPFSPHVPLPVFQPPAAEPTEQQRRDAALKEMAISEHAKVPRTKGARGTKAKAPVRRKRVRPSKEQVQAALAELERPS